MRFILLAMALLPAASSGQDGIRDSVAYLRALRLSSRADSLAQSTDRAKRLQALAIWQQAGETFASNGRPSDPAYMFGKIANVFQGLRELDSALAYNSKALTIWRTVANRELEDLAGEASTLFNVGDIYKQLGRPDSALTSFMTVLPIWRKAGNRAAEAATLDRIGGALSALSRRDSAVAYYTRALSMAMELRDREAEAVTLGNIGTEFMWLRKPDLALVYYTKALPIKRELKDRDGEAKTLDYIGRAHSNLGRPDSALVFYARALRIQRELRDRDGEATTLSNMRVAQDAISQRKPGSRAAEARALDSIGNVHLDRGRPDSALAYLTRALQIHRQVGSRSLEATSLLSIGLAYVDQGQLEAALNAFVPALPIWRETRDRLNEKKTLGYIGTMHDGLGRTDSALAYYMQAVGIRREMGNHTGDAALLNEIGMVHDRLGNADSAFAYYVQALPAARELADRDTEAKTLRNIGRYYGDAGRADSALVYYTRALFISREVQDRSGEAEILNNLGALQIYLGRQDSALAFINQALSIIRENENRADEAQVQISAGYLLSQLGQPDSALAKFELALAIARKAGNRDGESAAVFSIGRTLTILHEWDSALVYFGQALLIQRESKDREGEAATLNAIGMAQYIVGWPDSALGYLRRARPINRELRDRSSEARTLNNIGYALLDSGNDSLLAAAATFDSAASLFARLRRSAGGDADVISFAEGGGDTFGGWSRAWQRLAKQARLGGIGLAYSKAVASSLAAAERGRAQALRDLMDRRRGGTAVALTATDTMPGADLAAEAGHFLAPLRATRAALLYYLMDGDTLRSWFLSPSGELVVLSPVGRTEGVLTKAIATARTRIGADAVAARQRRGDSPAGRGTALRSGEIPMAGASRNAAAALQALAAIVLPPNLKTLLPKGSELVIVPHGDLGQVPFAALPLSGDTVPLGVRNALRYAPSLRALVASGDGGSKGNSALVVGNPLMPSVRDESGTIHQLSSLEGAASEGQWVASRLGTQAMTGVAASESAVRQLLPSASIVHLATHGLAYGSEARVRQSYVALAPSAGHDGLLTLGELLDDESLRLNADLVVLSACQTGLGETRMSEGTVGLQRGLLAKGARSVLVSLWSVDDAATRLLMQRFYTHWIDPNGRPLRSKPEALRRAQADVRDRAEYRNPRYWAPFQLVGAR